MKITIQKVYKKIYNSFQNIYYFYSDVEISFLKLFSYYGRRKIGYLYFDYKEGCHKFKFDCNVTAIDDEIIKELFLKIQELNSLKK